MSFFHQSGGRAYFLDNYLTYIPVCLPQVKVFEAACEALRVVAAREKQCRHYVK
jgi:hypothetical protein